MLETPKNDLSEFLSIVPAVLYEYVVYDDDSADSEFLYLTPNCEEILGRSVEYLMEDMNRFWEMVHPEDLERLVGESDAARAAGSVFRSEVRFVRPDGREMWVRLSSRPTPKTSRGDFIWAGYMIDVTEQKCAQAQLAASEGRYRRLVDNLSDQLVVFSESFDAKHMMYVSSGFECIFGVEDRAVLGKSLWSEIDWTPETLTQVGDSYRKLVSGEEHSQRLDCAFTHPSGLVRHVRVTQHIAHDERDDWFIEGVIENVTFQKETERLLQWAATHDALTGLANRQHVVALLEGEVRRARRSRLGLGMLMIDLDHFKEVNDRHGHVAGDRLLTAFGRELRDGLRDGDVAGRYGGEEFIVILPDITPDAAVVAAERLRARVQALQVQDGTACIDVTASIGVACLDDDTSSATALVDRADRALYAAKSAGRNRVEVAPPSTATHSTPTSS